MTLRLGVPHRALVLLLWFLVFLGSANAATVGTITGEVFDEAGDGVQGASVAVTQGATMVRSGTTGKGGAFTIGGIPVGTYTVIVSRAGYERLTRPDVTVFEGRTTALVLTLTSVPPAEPKVVYKKETTIELEDLDVQGELVKPSAALVLDRKTSNLNPLIQVGPSAARTSASTATAAAMYTPPASTEGYATIQESDFHVVADAPLSTFAADVDTASYANVRRFLQDGQAPPRDAVRIEELVNYFPYADARPAGDAPFAVTAEVTAAPWADGHRLARIGIQARDLEARDPPPRNLVFLVDVSGSMAGPDRLPLVKRGLTMLVGQLGRADHVAIVVYAGAAGTALPPTRGDDHATIEAAIAGLGAGGSTAGAAGIRAAYELARANFQKGAVNRVILATDGDFNVGVQSESELTQLVETERQSGVFLTVLGFGRGNLQDARMEMLADKGNGNYAYIDGWSELEKVLRDEIGATLVTVAKDVKLQVEFNPLLVSSYRLLGYENRALADRDFADDTKDAGDMGAGHHVTALYEIVPATVEVKPEVPALRYQGVRAPSEAARSGELFTVSIRYKAPDGDVSTLTKVPVRDDGRGFAQAGEDTRFAAAVAAFGMLLRQSEHAGSLDWDWVALTARGAVGADPGGYRHAFVSMVEQARRVAVR